MDSQHRAQSKCHCCCQGLMKSTRPTCHAVNQGNLQSSGPPRRQQLMNVSRNVGARWKLLLPNHSSRLDSIALPPPSSAARSCGQGPHACAWQKVGREICLSPSETPAARSATVAAGQLSTTCCCAGFPCTLAAKLMTAASCRPVDSCALARMLRPQSGTVAQIIASRYCNSLHPVSQPQRAMDTAVQTGSLAFA